MKDDASRSEEPSSSKALSAEVVIPNLKGLHARASAQFVKCAEIYDADIHVTHEGHTVLGNSIMGLMMLAAGQGNTILIETTGSEAKGALDALVSLVSDGFNEEN